MIRVVASLPVDVFMVDGEGLAAFASGQSFASWGGSTSLRDHSLSVVLPARPQWILLIKNPSPVAAAVQYDALITSYSPYGGPTGMSGSNVSFG
jgi:hypothetical protein